MAGFPTLFARVRDIGLLPFVGEAPLATVVGVDYDGTYGTFTPAVSVVYDDLSYMGNDTVHPDDLVVVAS